MRYSAAHHVHHQSGVALIIVLWVLALVTITAGTFSALARTEHWQARYALDSARARAAAEAGLHRAVYELRNPDEASRWIGDGRVYSFALRDMQVDVAITDERGKIDINVVDANTLLNLFIGQGLDEQMAGNLASAVMDWRDEDDLLTPGGAEAAEYEAAGLGYTPSNGPFVSVAEFQQVLGVSYELFQKLRPALTVYSRRRSPEAAFAPYEALLSLPGMTPDMAMQFVQDRQVAADTGGEIRLPTGEAVLARGFGSTYSIRARAILPNGTWDQIQAVVRISRGNTGKPFATLEWREGAAAQEQAENDNDPAGAGPDTTRGNTGLNC